MSNRGEEEQREKQRADGWCVSRRNPHHLDRSIPLQSVHIIILKHWKPSCSLCSFHCDYYRYFDHYSDWKRLSRHSIWQSSPIRYVRQDKWRNLTYRFLSFSRVRPYPLSHTANPYAHTQLHTPLAEPKRDINILCSYFRMGQAKIKITKNFTGATNLFQSLCFSS